MYDLICEVFVVGWLCCGWIVLELYIGVVVGGGEVIVLLIGLVVEILFEEFVV